MYGERYGEYAYWYQGVTGWIMRCVVWVGNKDTSCVKR